MVDIPQDELMAMPYGVDNGLTLATGSRVVELGNKKNGTGLYREFYEAQGLSYVCLDWNGQDGAIKLDMGQRIPEELYDDVMGGDLVTNFGFTEHVFTDQVQCWYNVAELSGKVGCYLAMCMPFPGHWEHHGVYQPQPEWYMAWCANNGYRIHTLFVNDQRKRFTIVVGAQRVDIFDPVKYYHPSDKLVHVTDPARRVNPEERKFR